MSANMRKSSIIQEIVCKYEKIVCKYHILLELPITTFRGFCKAGLNYLLCYLILGTFYEGGGGVGKNIYPSHGGNPADIIYNKIKKLNLNCCSKKQLATRLKTFSSKGADCLGRDGRGCCSRKSSGKSNPPSPSRNESLRKETSLPRRPRRHS